MWRRGSRLATPGTRPHLPLGGGGFALDPSPHLHYGLGSPYRKEIHMNDILTAAIYVLVGVIVGILAVQVVATVATETVIKVLKEHGR